MSATQKLLTLARRFGICVTEHSPGHCHIHGLRLVNYWPDSKRLTAHARGDKKARRRVGTYEAIEMAMTLPCDAVGRPTIQRARRQPVLRFDLRTNWEG